MMPGHPLDPLLSWLQHDPDMSESDHAVALDAHLQEQRAIKAMLRGEVGLDYVCDLLAEHDQVDDWIDETLDHLERINDGGVPFVCDPSVSVLYLPEHLRWIDGNSPG